MGAAWKRHALDPAGRVADSRAYVFAALDAFRAGVSGRAPPSRPASPTPTAQWARRSPEAGTPHA